MYLEQPQQDFLSHNFNVLHGKQGQTLEAAHAAASRLREVDTQGFEDLSVAIWHGELLLQAVTLFNSAAKKSETYEETVHLLEQSAQIQLAHSPIAPTREEAVKRVAYFEKVFQGKADATVRTFREFLNVVDFLSILEPTEHRQIQLQSLMEQLLTDLTHRSGDSGIYILRIERDTVPSAARAFIAFLVQYFQTNAQNPDELESVFKKFLQRIAPNAPGTAVHVAHHHLRVLALQRKPTEHVDASIIQDLLNIRYIGIQGELLQLSPSRS